MKTDTPRNPLLSDSSAANASPLIRGASGMIRKVVVLVVGSIMLLAGVAMIILPGPALVVIPAALALLATEFPWARRLLDRLLALARRAWVAVKVRWRNYRQARSGVVADGASLHKLSPKPLVPIVTAQGVSAEKVKNPEKA